MEWTPERFYAERDKRTLEYTGKDILKDTGIYISIDPNLYKTPSGQLCVIALANMLGRVHRNIKTSIPRDNKIPLLIPTVINKRYFSEEVYTTLMSLDPFGVFGFSKSPPLNSLVIGIGNQPPHKADFYLGADGYCGNVTTDKTEFNTSKATTVFGGALVACLGANTAFKHILGINSLETTLSLWNFKEGAEAQSGPNSYNPLIIDNILMVGTGAVGSGVAFWSHLLGHESTWFIIDKDIVKIHNLNRCLSFFVKHTDWNNNKPSNKVDVIHDILKDSFPFKGTYKQALQKISNFNFDVILCLANEDNVRALINYKPCQLFLQATTGNNWMAQLHRHLPLEDDCIFCRTGNLSEAKFSCSSVDIKNEEKSTDAALPALSGLSSLMLTSALYHMKESQFLTNPENDIRFDLRSQNRIVSFGRRTCKKSCSFRDFWLTTKNTTPERSTLTTKSIKCNCSALLEKS